MDAFTPDELLFELPVYRLSPDGFREALRGRVQRAGEEYVANKPSWESQSDKAGREYAENHERHRYGRPYWYNEMIGVIRLYQDGGSIKAEFWGQDQRSFRWNFRHQEYRNLGRLFEYHAGPTQLSSSEIYEVLLQQFSRLTRSKGPLARRHIDLYAFQRIGPYVDWRSVLGWWPSN